MDRKPDTTDRDRLKQIEQSDLTESKVNQDFVDWLKKKGPNYLLIILAALSVYMLFTRWSESKVRHNIEAWEALATADLPRSKEDVAAEYENIRGVPELAQITAARQYLQSIRADATIASLIAQSSADALSPQTQFQPNTVDVTEPLSDEQRAQNLSEAERLFQTVLDTVTDVDGHAEPGRLLLKIAALDGLAAVAESRGETEKAQQYLEQVISDSDSIYPQLAKQARDRTANMNELVTVTALPTVGEVGQQALVTTFESDIPKESMLPSLQRLIESDDDSTIVANAPFGN